jgi:hypothetical protein
MSIKIKNLFDIIKDLDKRLKNLETGNVNITFTVPKHSSNPATGTDGEIIYNTTSNKFKGRANGSWTDLH